MSRQTRRRIRPAAAILTALAMLAALPVLAGAATFTVNTTVDQAPTPSECGGVAGDCGLRQAVDKANAEPGPDTVILPAGTYRLTIAGSGFDENGDLNVTEGALTVQGSGARHTTIDASGNESRVFEVEGGTSLALSGLTVTGGRTEGDGGGIAVEGASLSLEGVAVTGNESFNSGYGGGIYSEASDVSIRGSSIVGNRNSGDGGGIGAFGQPAGSLTIENSTIADNVVDTSLYPGDPGWGAFGGAMEAYVGDLTMRNVTISGNSIHDGNGGAPEGDGAAIAAEPEAGDQIHIVNTIVFGNTATSTGQSGQCYKTLTSEGHNLEGATPTGEPRCFAAASDLIANPLLGALGNNGGETDTLALTAGSPAIDAGDNTQCPATDQRGVARPQGASCDIGAFELVPAPAVVPPPAPVAIAKAVLKLNKVKLNPKKGSATLFAQVSGPGKLTLSGAKASKAKRSARAAGIVKLLVKAKGKAEKELGATGRAKVKVKVAFAPSGGGSAVTKTKSITLVKKGG